MSLLIVQNALVLGFQKLLDVTYMGLVGESAATSPPVPADWRVRKTGIDPLGDAKGSCLRHCEFMLMAYSQSPVRARPRKRRTAAQEDSQHRALLSAL
jgi:hypothetical protein